MVRRDEEENEILHFVFIIFIKRGNKGMLKKIISYAIIFSIFYSDTVFCMENELHRETPKSQSRTSRTPQPLPQEPLTQSPAFPQSPVKVSILKAQQLSQQVPQTPLGAKKIRPQQQLSLTTASEQESLVGNNKNYGSFSSPTHSGSPAHSDSSPHSDQTESLQDQVSLQALSILGSSGDQSDGSKSNRSDQSTSPSGKNLQESGSLSAEPEDTKDISKQPTQKKPGEKPNIPGNEDDEVRFSDSKTKAFEDPSNLELQTVLLDLDNDSTGAWEFLGKKGKTPSQKLVPDWCKSTNGTSEHAVNDPLISLDQDVQEDETAKISLSMAQNSLEQLLNTLPNDARATLKKQVAQWEEAGAMLFGAALGGGAAYGITVLYGQSIFNLATQFDPDFAELLAGHGLATYILLSSISDAAVRNALYGKKVLSYLSNRDATMKESLFLGAITFLPSLITPFALIAAEFEYIKIFNFPVMYDQEIKEMLLVAPILYLNDWAFNINMASEMKEWAQTSNSRFARLISGRVCYPSLPSEEVIRERERDFNNKLNLLLRNLPQMSDEDITEFYEILTNASSLIEEGLPELDPKYIESAQTFLTLLYLLTEGDKIEQDIKLSQKPIVHPTQEESKLENLHKIAEEDVQYTSFSPLVSYGEEDDHSILTARSWYEKGTDVMNYLFLSTGSMVRLLTLKFVMHEMLEYSILAMGMLAGHPEASINIEWAAWAIAALIAFPMQTGFEYMSMKNLANMFWSTEHDGHESYPWARAGVKLYSLLQGFILTVPIGVLALTACTEAFGEDWLWDPEHTERKALLSFVLTYLVPEWAVQTTLIEEAYNQTILTGTADVCHSPLVWPKITGLRDRYNSVQPINTLKWESDLRNYRQDWLIRFIKEKQKGMKKLHPEILSQLEKVLPPRSEKKI